MILKWAGLRQIRVEVSSILYDLIKNKIRLNHKLANGNQLFLNYFKEALILSKKAFCRVVNV